MFCVLFVLETHIDTIKISFFEANPQTISQPSFFGIAPETQMLALVRPHQDSANEGLGALLILGSVPIDNPPDHFLIGCTTLLSFFLKKLDTRLFQGDGYLNVFFLQDQLIRWREKIFNDSQLPHWFISIFYFALHRSSFLFSNSPHHKCG